jgi:K+-sensing histidine kinase KdpD
MISKVGLKSRPYLLSFFIMVIAVTLQYLIITIGNIPVPGLLYPMTFLVAWYYGFMPAFVMVIISLFASNFLFYEPKFTFKFLEFSDYVRLGIFAVTSLVAGYIVAGGKKAHMGERNAKLQLKESLEVLETINRVGQSMSAELDHQKLVQQVTDAGTQLSKAEFGAFFYNVIDDKGEAYTLYTISGVPKSLFDNFPMPRNTEIFASTFFGKGNIRSDDITQDPRYGKNEPYFGMPKGHLPVKSYLAIPVRSRDGDVIGGLFFGHTQTAMFTEKEELIVTGLAAQAAIAMDNARLFDKARQAIHIRDEFLSISSHELRTPLTPLKIQLQSLMRRIEKGSFNDLTIEELKKMIGLAEKQVNRITILVDDLLDVTRITSGKLTLNFETIEVVEVVREVLERYKSQLEIARCELILDLDDLIIAKIDKLRFEQILVNLLTNAIKYAPGKPITITLKTDALDKKLILKVADMGVGISMEDQKRVFDRFERVDSHAAQGGLGLGLYIVKQIVSAHGGMIEMESQEGLGTTFIVKIPLIAT